jgi:hypothetical protein
MYQTTRTIRADGAALWQRKRAIALESVPATLHRPAKTTPEVTEQINRSNSGLSTMTITNIAGLAYQRRPPGSAGEAAEV